MAMAEKKSLFVHGEKAGRVTTGNPITDLERAQDVARRYRCEFVDLATSSCIMSCSRNFPRS